MAVKTSATNAVVFPPSLVYLAPCLEKAGLIVPLDTFTILTPTDSTEQKRAALNRITKAAQDCARKAAHCFAVGLSADWLASEAYAMRESLRSVDMSWKLKDVELWIKKERRELLNENKRIEKRLNRKTILPYGPLYRDRLENVKRAIEQLDIAVRGDNRSRGRPSKREKAGAVPGVSYTLGLARLKSMYVGKFPDAIANRADQFFYRILNQAQKPWEDNKLRVAWQNCAIEIADTMLRAADPNRFQRSRKRQMLLYKQRMKSLVKQAPKHL